MSHKISGLEEKPAKNYIYPFFWPDENVSGQIADEIRAVYESGCGGLCLEARPFEKFGQTEWWETAKTVLDEAKKRDMKVWILDDRHFPTGSANGYLEKNYPEKRRRFIIEHHFDVYGPKNDISVHLPDCTEFDKIVCAVAFKRSGNDEEICGEPLEIGLIPGAEYAEFSIPDGLWRVFFILETSSVDNRSHPFYIDMLSKDSAHILIEAVYEEHFKNLGEYFGSTLEGFFSDEPSFDCEHTESWGSDAGFYFRTVGQPGNSLPWNSSVLSKMKDLPEGDFFTYAPALWYNHEKHSPVVRYSYMDAVTRLWYENFSLALGTWCRDHGLIYTGHIIEDNNAHSRLGASAGHYFRGLSGQDISGIDIVLHQVLPGMSDYYTAAAISKGGADGRFFHYTLAHLASSLARITPHMADRAMCEMFGAYGWAEDLPMMKWIADFLMIRGINRFVPHAFSVKYPFDDCPPHFYAKGCNPQFDGFSRLMPYINKVISLLDGAERKTDGAILYYAENEWVSDGSFMYGDVPAKILYDNHIDYDIIPVDALENAEITNGELTVNGKKHSFLIIPGAKNYCEKVKALARKFITAGLPVFTLTDGKYGGFGKTVTENELIGEIRKHCPAADYHIPESKLRIAEYDRENEKYFYLFNEEPAQTVKLEITLPATGTYTEIHLLNGEIYSGITESGKITAELVPGESVIFAFGQDEAEFPAKPVFTNRTAVDIKWDISLLETGTDSFFREYKKQSGLFNITALDRMPDFSGKIRYFGKFISDAEKGFIDLGQVGSTAQISLNGKDYPVLICAPYRINVSDSLKKGENEIEITVCNTLTNRVYDWFSGFLPIQPSGLTGPVTLLT